MASRSRGGQRTTPQRAGVAVAATADADADAAGDADADADAEGDDGDEGDDVKVGPGVCTHPKSGRWRGPKN